ncbi:hypothetical protein GF327_02085 [Candidatus Woesearchaeota archaeon]|nr:hypothetical protein [Candidatus Woesearchaeota archaeon]
MEKEIDMKKLFRYVEFYKLIRYRSIVEQGNMPEINENRVKEILDEINTDISKAQLSELSTIEALINYLDELIEKEIVRDTYFENRKKAVV